MRGTGEDSTAISLPQISGSQGGERVARAPVFPTDRKLRRDLKTLATFIGIYCGERHADVEKQAVCMKSHDVTRIAGRPVTLCPSCTKLLMHAFVKRTSCPYNPKPACKHCQSHCYHNQYRDQIREVMRYSGKRLVLSGRLDYFFKLLF